MSRHPLRMKAVAAMSAALMATGVAGAPEADAQGGTSTMGGAAIALMFLGGLIFVEFPQVEEGGPGWVDIVGQPCDADCDEAKWDVSIHSLSSAYYVEHTRQRIVIPKNVGKPVIRNAEHREHRTGSLNPANPPYETGDPTSENGVLTEFSKRLPEMSDAEATALLQRVWERYSEDRPEPLFMPTHSNKALMGHSDKAAQLSGLGGHDEYILGSGDIPSSVSYNSGRIDYTPFLDRSGEQIRLLTAHRDVDHGDLTVFYQRVPQDLRDSLALRREYYPVGGKGVSTDFGPEVYKDVIPASEIPSRTEFQGSPVEVDPEGDLVSFYTILSDEMGIPYNGELSTDISGWLYGQTVLPKKTSPLDVYEVEGTTSTLIPPKADGEDAVEPTESWEGAEFPVKVGPDGSVDPTTKEGAALSYTVSESPSGENWVMDVYSPPSQTTFEVAAKKDPEAIERGEKYAMAQAYTSETCNKWDGATDWTCISPLDYQWGRGDMGVDQYQDPYYDPFDPESPPPRPPDTRTDGVIRGTLEIDAEQEARFDAAPDTEPMRGIFGNPQCRVTRPTGDPEDYSALASTRLPSDMNVSFPGQPENLGIPMYGEWYEDEIEYEGVVSGNPFSYEDACDQAAVPLACEADEEIPSTPPSTEPTSPTTEPTTSQTTSSEPPTSPTDPTTDPTTSPTTGPGPSTPGTSTPTPPAAPTTPGTTVPSPGPGPATDTPAPPRPNAPSAPPLRAPAGVLDEIDAVSDEKTGPVVDTGGTVKVSWLDRLVAAMR